MLRSEEMVRELAYALWERAGRPEGEAERFWFEAEHSLSVSAAPPRVRKAPAESAAKSSTKSSTKSASKPKTATKAPAGRRKVTA